MAQERSSARIFIVAVGLLAAVHAVAAKDINVGGTRGWDYAPPSDAAYYDTWASKETFTAGDNLVFSYTPGAHDVQVVSATEYNACSMSTGKKYLSGGDSVSLPTPGTYYFVCSFPSHCDMGMKMKITVKAAGGVPPVVAPVTPPVTPPVRAPTRAPLVAPVPAPVVKAPAPAPVIKAPTPGPALAPVPSPTDAPTPSENPSTAPTPGSSLAPGPELPPPPPSAAVSIHQCLSFVGAVAVVAFCVLRF